MAPSLLSLIAMLLMLASEVHPQADTTAFQFDSFDPNPSGLTYERDAFVPTGTEFLRLTKTNSTDYPQPLSVGRVLYSTPVKLWDTGRQAAFQTTITLSITSVNERPADGMTFFIVPVNSTTSSGGTGGNLGIFGSVVRNSPIFAVEFDTYVNNGTDPNFRHIGVDINTKDSLSVASFENAFGQVVTALINYDPTTKTISVVATYGSQTSTTSYVFDLKTVLPQQVQVGISAATGPQVALHDVHSWYFTSTLVWEGGDQDIKQYV